jgi:hypothetical protein
LAPPTRRALEIAREGTASAANPLGKFSGFGRW